MKIFVFCYCFFERLWLIFVCLIDLVGFLVCGLGFFFGELVGGYDLSLLGVVRDCCGLLIGGVGNLVGFVVVL